MSGSLPMCDINAPLIMLMYLECGNNKAI